MGSADQALPFGQTHSFVPGPGQVLGVGEVTVPVWAPAARAEQDAVRALEGPPGREVAEETPWPHLAKSTGCRAGTTPGRGVVREASWRWRHPSGLSPDILQPLLSPAQELVRPGGKAGASWGSWGEEGCLRRNKPEPGGAGQRRGSLEHLSLARPQGCGEERGCGAGAGAKGPGHQELCVSPDLGGQCWGLSLRGWGQQELGARDPVIGRTGKEKLVRMESSSCQR